MSPFYKNSITEKELVERCLRLDPKAQRMLFDTFSGKLMTICRRYGRTRQEAEDMLQESLIRIYSNLDKYKSDGSLEGWIRRITVNTSIKVLKKKGNRFNLDDITDYSIDGGMHSELQILEAEDLISIINLLPVGYKSVFNLYEIEGYSHKEIGTMLSISESTSRSQLTKAKKMLRLYISKIQKRAI